MIYYSIGGTPTTTECNFFNNIAGGNGGAMYVNSATQYHKGGAIYVYSAAQNSLSVLDYHFIETIMLMQVVEQYIKQEVMILLL